MTVRSPLMYIDPQARALWVHDVVPTPINDGSLPAGTTLVAVTDGPADGDDVPVAPSRRPHVVRLAVFLAVLLVMFYLVAVQHVIDIEAVRATIAKTGPIAPLVYIPASAVLASMFVPGPLLAAGSGLLFGPVLGTLVTLCSASATATLAAFLGRRAGRDSARALVGAEWAGRIDGQIQQRGLWAVVGQRFVPGISDAMASYVFGAFGMPLWQMVIGAFIGSAPRAFVYTALGASISDLNSPLAYTAVAVWCVTAIIGAFAAHRGYRSWRGHQNTAARG